MKESFLRFMQGRYGVDAFSQVLGVIAMIALICGMFFPPYGSIVGLLLTAYAYFRMFSRNISARAAENKKFLTAAAPIKNWIAGKRQAFLQRKTHSFYSCPACKKTVRITKPPHKGKNIEITCSNCQGKFIRKS